MILYILIGALWTLLIDWMLRQSWSNSEKLKLTTTQHIVSIVIWPVTLCIFIGGFIYGTIHTNKQS